MTRNRSRQFCCLLLLGIWLNVATALAAPERGSLLQLVGSDAGVVIEVDNLRDELNNAQNCEVLQRLRQTNLFQKWKKSDDFRNLVVARSVIEQLVGKPLGQFVDDLFGQSVVVAVYPTADEQGDVVLITRAKTSADLDSAIAAWNRAERSKLTPLEYDGHTYTLREKVKDKQKPQPPQFTTRFGSVLVLANSEPAIQRVISLNQAAAAIATGGDPATPRTQSFQQSSAYRLAVEALPQTRFVTLHVNPRAWDDRLDLDPKKSKAAKDLLSLWQRCDSLAFALTVDRNGVFIDGLVHTSQTDETLLPAKEEADAVPAFLSRVPRRAVAVFAGRHNLSRLASVLMGWIPDNERQDFSRGRILARGMLSGFDLIDDIIPSLGKHWGVYLVEAKGDTAQRAPLDAVLGVELPPPGQVKRGNITLRDSLDNALQTTLRLVASFTGGKDSDGGTNDVETERHARGAVIRAIDAGRSIRPAFSLTNHHLTVGTSQTAVAEFVGLSEDDSLAADPALQQFAQRRFAGSTQLMYIDAAALRGVIGANESSLAKRLAGSDKMDLAASLQRIRGLNNLLQAFDTLFVAGQADGPRIHLRAGISADVADSDR